MKSRAKKNSNFRIFENKLLLLLIFIAAVFIPFLFQQNQKRYTIDLSDAGFSRQEISIEKGSQITWVISGNNPHWPASDVHPLHNSYPEKGGCFGSKLDACRGLKEGEKYSFTFENTGEWGIHDHIYPHFTMVVKVKEMKSGISFDNIIDRLGFSSKNTYPNRLYGNHAKWFSENQKKLLKELNPSMMPLEASAKAHDICANLEGSKFREKQHCYSEVFYYITSNKDQRFAFQTLENLRKKDRSTQSCHLIAHGIGWAMFDKDPGKWQDAIGEMSPECSYGGIHGVVEQYSVVTGTPLSEKELASVCIKNPSWACYHAIGHVLLVQTKNDLGVAADLCSTYSEKMPKLSCLNGVFMEHMIAQNLAEHGFATNERRKYFYNHLDDFEKLCLAQKGDLARSCWTEIIHASVNKYKGNIDQMYALCDRAHTLEAAMGCRRHALAEILPLKNFEPVEGVYICRREINNDPSFEQDCYMTMASVAMSNAPYRINSVIEFCTQIPQAYHTECLNRIGHEMSLLSSKAPTRADELCHDISSEFKYLCNSKKFSGQSIERPGQ